MATTGTIRTISTISTVGKRRADGWAWRARWAALDRLARAVRDDAGMSTAEYAIGTIAAAAFAAVLYTVVTGDSVTSALDSLVQEALSVDF